MNDNIQENQQSVMAVLEPYFSKISEIYESAVRLYNEATTAQARADHDSRAALSAIYRHAWMGYQRELGEQAGFHFLKVRGLHVLNIRDKVVLRAKRVDENGLHVNNQTEQQRNFDRQRPIPGLPEEASRIVVGYQLDPAFSAVERVIVRNPATGWAAQVVVADDIYAWNDITPIQLPLQMKKAAITK
jgi:hypothetical protein